MNLSVVRRNGEKHLILFDDADGEIVLAHTWSVMRSTSGIYYAVTSARTNAGIKTTLRMHVLLMGQRHIDHINRNGLDNRRANLRLANHSQNAANTPALAGTSQYKGVSWWRPRSRWRAQIRVDGQKRTVGTFRSEADAAFAYDNAAREAWGEFATLNFPGEQK